MKLIKKVLLSMTLAFSLCTAAHAELIWIGGQPMFVSQNQPAIGASVYIDKKFGAVPFFILHAPKKNPCIAGEWMPYDVNDTELGFMVHPDGDFCFIYPAELSDITALRNIVSQEGLVTFGEALIDLNGYNGIRNLMVAASKQ